MVMNSLFTRPVATIRCSPHGRASTYWRIGPSKIWIACSKSNPCLAKFSSFLSSSHSNSIARDNTPNPRAEAQSGIDHIDDKIATMVWQASFVRWERRGGMAANSLQMQPARGGGAAEAGPLDLAPEGAAEALPHPAYTRAAVQGPLPSSRPA